VKLSSVRIRGSWPHSDDGVPPFAIKSAIAAHSNNTLGGANSQRQRVIPRLFDRIKSRRCQFARLAEMSSEGHETPFQAALAALEAAVSLPSPADRFNIDREGPAKRAAKLRALQQRFQKLNEYCDEAAAEIRASLERTPPR
jgi:hypothetical protein